MKLISEGGRRLVALVLGTVAAVGAGPAGAAEDIFDGAWHFSATPYLWLPDVHATLNYPLGRSGSVSADATPGGYLQNLDFAAMLAGEARRGNWSVFTDYIYLRFSADRTPVRFVTDPTGNVAAPVGFAGSADLTSNVWTLAGGYTVWSREPGFIDLFGGFRYLNFQSTIDWNLATPAGNLPFGGARSQSVNQWDGILGFNGQVRLGDGKWFMPYYADIGTASNNWTWQAMAGVGYQFGWGDLSLVVRSLSYSFDDAQLDLRMTGPALGATFRF
jgi:hypothetical protein